MKKFLAALLSLAMLATMCSAFAVDAPSAPNSARTQTTPPAPSGGGTVSSDPSKADVQSFQGVTLRVEGAKKNLLQEKVSFTDGTALIQLVEEALKKADISCTVTDGNYGKYISAINGEEEGTFGGYDGWRYLINGQAPSVSMSQYQLTGGEEILLVYGDMDQLTPIITVTLKDGQAILTITADVTTYDESWNATVTRQPVEGATVTADGVEYATDAQGQVTLSKASTEKKTVSFQVEKYDEKGLPLLVRQAPDYQLVLEEAAKEPDEPVNISFTDVPEGKWYTPYVTEMARIGAIKGDSSGAFRPLGQLTRAEAISVLFNLSGGKKAEGTVPFTDVPEGKWFYDAIQWALSKKLMNSASSLFSPNLPLSRQELAVLLVRYQEQVVGQPMNQEGEAPAFEDNDQIASYAAPAVYALQKAGIVSGNNGRFQPLGTATRAELCKMLHGLLALPSQAQGNSEN